MMSMASATAAAGSTSGGTVGVARVGGRGVGAEGSEGLRTRERVGCQRRGEDR